MPEPNNEWSEAVEKGEATPAPEKEDREERPAPSKGTMKKVSGERKTFHSPNQLRGLGIANTGGEHE